MPFESRPKYVDGPRQQLTTGTEVCEWLLKATQQLTTGREARNCLLKANPGVLLAQANNSPRDGG